MSTISLNGMQFYAHHGCFQDEQTIGTHFMVDLSICVDTSKAERDDALESTINYADLYLLVKQQMQQPSHLLENVAFRIATAVKEAYAAVEEVAVTVRKLNPPLGGQLHSASVQLTL